VTIAARSTTRTRLLDRWLFAMVNSPGPAQRSGWGDEGRCRTNRPGAHWVGRWPTGNRRCGRAIQSGKRQGARQGLESVRGDVFVTVNRIGRLEGHASKRDQAIPEQEGDVRRGHRDGVNANDRTSDRLRAPVLDPVVAQDFDRRRGSMDGDMLPPSWPFALL